MTELRDRDPRTNEFLNAMWNLEDAIGTLRTAITVFERNPSALNYSRMAHARNVVEHWLRIVERQG